MNIFIICGYGLVKDINADVNYRTYLNLAFNHMYSAAANQPSMIIPCGGPTIGEDVFEGTEAALIGDYVQSMMERTITSKQTMSWKVVLEDQSLSSLENLLFAKRLIDEQSAEGSVTIFCEATRADKIRALSEKIFAQPVVVEPIDFDVSQNRYLEDSAMKQKEARGLAEALWALESPENLAYHHAAFAAKIDFFRQRQSEGASHADVITEWFAQAPEILKRLIPNHPLL